MKKENIDTIFEFSDNLKIFEKDKSTQTFTFINELSNKRKTLSLQPKYRQPYHINVIDLLRANENAHSRILCSLLQQHSNGQYEIFSSFAKRFISDIQQTITHPKFTSEKHRIDLLIEDDNKYAIIFENKIHNAVIQKNQIARYINKVKELGYTEDKIYVVYLPSDGSKEPNACCWRQEESFCNECEDTSKACENTHSYLDSFKDRYRLLSFRDHILPWLKEDVLLNCRIKDFYLQSCITQYIDHLEGLFDLREFNNNLNMELQEHIKSLLKLEDNPEMNHQTVKKKMTDINQVLNQLSLLEGQIEVECWQLWKSRLKKEYPQYEIIADITNKRYPKVGIKIRTDDKAFTILIEKDTNIYYGISQYSCTEKKDPAVTEFVTLILSEIEDFKTSDTWYGWRYTSFENGYGRLKTLITNVETKLRPEDSHQTT